MGMITGPVSGVLGANAAIDEGHARRTLDYQNQAMANESARSALAAGNIQAGLALTKGSLTAGQAKAGYAASGVNVGSGSALDAMRDTRLMSKVDADTIQSNAAKEAFGYQTKGYEYGVQAQIDKMATDQQVMSSILGGYSSGVSSMASFGGKLGS